MSVYGQRDEFRASAHARVPNQRGGWLASYWWVFLFISLCTGVYLNAAHKKEQVLQSLQRQHDKLVQEKELALQQNEDLHLQINSQSDPEWIQLTLMKGLGLVPEGYVKVYFHGDEMQEVGENAKTLGR